MENKESARQPLPSLTGGVGGGSIALVVSASQLFQPPAHPLQVLYLCLIRHILQIHTRLCHLRECEMLC